VHRRQSKTSADAAWWPLKEPRAPQRRLALRDEALQRESIREANATRFIQQYRADLVATAEVVTGGHIAEVISSHGPILIGLRRGVITTINPRGRPSTRGMNHEDDLKRVDAVVEALAHEASLLGDNVQLLGVTVRSGSLER